MSNPTGSLLFTGTPDALDKVKEILTRIDVVSPQDGQIQQLGESTFLIIKIHMFLPRTANLCTQKDSQLIFSVQVLLINPSPLRSAT
jgi:hypothetical protein